MPFEDMLDIWLKSGHLERDFWALTLRQYDRWFRANFDHCAPFGRADLEALIERFPDVD